MREDERRLFLREALFLNYTLLAGSNRQEEYPS